jgi:hypothetical protein
MKPFQSRYPRLNGKIYLDLEREARRLHNEIVKRTKRNPYVRSKYFKNSKIFIGLFWNHLNQKNQNDRRRRLVYYRCAIDLLRNSTCDPEMKINPNGKREMVYRFAGRSSDGYLFMVQVKRDERSDNKYFMSVFPYHNLDK